MNYRLLIDYDVIEFLEKLSRKDQRLLRDRFVAIREYPQRFSDCNGLQWLGRILFRGMKVGRVIPCAPGSASQTTARTE